MIIPGKLPFPPTIAEAFTRKLHLKHSPNFGGQSGCPITQHDK